MYLWQILIMTINISWHRNWFVLDTHSSKRSTPWSKSWNPPLCSAPWPSYSAVPRLTDQVPQSWPTRNLSSGMDCKLRRCSSLAWRCPLTFPPPSPARATWTWWVVRSQHSCQPCQEKILHSILIQEITPHGLDTISTFDPSKGCLRRKTHR